MTRDDLLSALQRLHACSEALSWVRSQSGNAYDLWCRCDRGDWLLWLAARAGVDRRLVVLAACDCAEPALAHVPVGEERPSVAIETARRWARGEATIGEARAAAAYAYAYAASTDDADDAAADAAYAAARAAETAYAASTDAADAAADAADTRSLAESARLVRRRIPWSVVRDALSGGES